MRSISSKQRNDVIALLQNGKSFRQVASECKLSLGTIHTISKTVNPGKKIQKAGRPKKLTPTDKHYCVHQMTRGGEKSVVDICRALKRDHSVSVSRQTVGRALNLLGLAAIEKESRPLITKVNAKKRLAWCRAHRDWTEADWARVIFTDETKINRFNSDGRTWAWIRDNEAI